MTQPNQTNFRELKELKNMAAGSSGWLTTRGMLQFKKVKFMDCIRHENVEEQSQRNSV